MDLLDALRQALPPPAAPAGEMAASARLRHEAYRALFESEPLCIILRDSTEAPGRGGADVHVYRLPENPEIIVAVTSGLSDYRMTLADGEPIRREVVQYLGRYGSPRLDDSKEAMALSLLSDLVRLQDLARVPTARGVALDCFQTLGLMAGPWPGAVFLPPPVPSHESFSLVIDGDAVDLLWYIPLTAAELVFAQANGVESLMQRMDKADLPWVFDPADRPDLLAAVRMAH